MCVILFCVHLCIFLTAEELCIKSLYSPVGEGQGLYQILSAVSIQMTRSSLLLHIATPQGPESLGVDFFRGGGAIFVHARWSQVASKTHISSAPQWWFRLCVKNCFLTAHSVFTLLLEKNDLLASIPPCLNILLVFACESHILCLIPLPYSSPFIFNENDPLPSLFFSRFKHLYFFNYSLWHGVFS